MRGIQQVAFVAVLRVAAGAALGAEGLNKGGNIWRAQRFGRCRAATLYGSGFCVTAGQVYRRELPA